MNYVGNAKVYETPDKKEVFDYLDALRESGVTNMFGASPYLEDRFGLTRHDARALLIEWMEGFGK